MPTSKTSKTSKSTLTAPYCAEEFDWMDQQIKEAKKEFAESVEKAYRRGFSQGFYACFEMIHDGFSLKQAEEMHDRIENWRYLRPLKKVITPSFAQFLIRQWGKVPPKAKQQKCNL